MKIFKTIYILKFFVLTIVIIILQNCKTREQALKELAEENIKYNRFDDEYVNYKYINYDLGLTLTFDGNWVINAKFENFDDFQKKYARYFYSEHGEVLFVGYNDEKKIGIRCTCEKLGIDNEKYLKKLKASSADDIEKYKIEFIKDGKEATLKNVKALQTIFETKINSNNIFKFNSVIFKKDSYNYKIDIWAFKEIFDREENFISSILDTIDFISEDEIKLLKQNDNTGDVLDK